VSGCLPSLLISGSYVAPEHESLLAVVAEPLSSTTDFLESLSAHPDWNDEVRALVSSAVTNRQHSYSPSLAVPNVPPGTTAAKLELHDSAFSGGTTVTLS
jgi:hypothetical protein